MPQVGDKVIPQRSETVYEIFHVHLGGAWEATRTPALHHCCRYLR